MAEFELDITSEWIIVEGLRFAPAEADNLKSAISFAGGMREFSSLPPSIDFEQFTVQFFEDGTLVASRTGYPEEIKFDFNTVDTLILAIQKATEICLDQYRLRPSPRHSGSLDMFNSGDVIEGR